jgi:hypothetical protein
LRSQTELFSVVLNSTNIGTIIDDTGDGIILNDDAEFSGNKASFLDGQGNRVTISTTKGTLSDSNLVLTSSGVGVQLSELDLTTGGFEGANITITARPTLAGGDGFAHVGYINATGIALGKVSVSGDLGQIDAGPVKNLTVQSLGRLGLSTQAPGGSLVSNLSGDLGKLQVKTDVDGATLIVDGSIKNVVVGGHIVGGTGAHSGSIEATGSIAKAPSAVSPAAVALPAAASSPDGGSHSGAW